MKTYNIQSGTIHRHKRGCLPHCDSPDLVQFVTFRLADSLPKTFLSALKHRRDTKQITEIEYHRAIEKALDLGSGLRIISTGDLVHLGAVRKYIDENPVKAGLCSAAEEWPWGSAGWRGDTRGQDARVPA